MSILSNKQREDFFIRLYFNTSKGYHHAGIFRAYLDFSRTLKIKNKEQHPKRKEDAFSWFNDNIQSLTNPNFSSQKEFDNKHEELCKNLVKYWSTLTIGQAQKWINMTLKYWLLLGKERIPNIEQNAQYFHIPIDGYVQRGMFKKEFPKPKPWSKISDYNEYFKYQSTHREKNPDTKPIIDEFEFFNDSIIQ